jgi:hypothetical protein
MRELLGAGPQGDVTGEEPATAADVAARSWPLRHLPLIVAEV